MTLLCIDVSRWQGVVDFFAVARAGNALVFLKATQGVGFVDPMLAADRKQAHAAGLTVGYYHFASAGDPIAEADAFCAAVGKLQPGELVALDWETTGPNPPAWCKTWLDRVHARLGVKPLLYLNQSELNGFNWSLVVAGDYGLWLADYDGSPSAIPPHGQWPAVAIKQWTSTGSVPGVQGNVDRDIFEGDAAALAHYGYQENDMVPTDLLNFPIVASDGKSYPFRDFIVQTNDKAYQAARDAAAALSAVQNHQPVQVDAGAVATALAGNTTFLSALAKAVNDDAAARLKS